MDTAWPEDFLALVDLGHFLCAAEQRNITQPAFSRRVRALEDWVGTPLFDRNELPVTLMGAGESFRLRAEVTHDGRSLRILTLIDEHSRTCLALKVARRINSLGVIEALADAMCLHGIPENIRCRKH